MCYTCSDFDRVCMRASEDETPFVFLYKTLFKALKLTLPCSPFQCEVLCAINVAPTKLHPNSLAFVRAFEIVCIELVIVKFFHFYSLRLGKQARWVSLHGHHNNRLFSIFTSSYKKFKTDLFKVRSSPEELAFFLNQYDELAFPLYWTLSPSRIADTYHLLDASEREEVYF